MKRFLQMILPALLCLVLFGAVVFFYVIPRVESSISKEKIKTTQDFLRTARELLISYHRQVQAGILERDEAQARALSRLRQLRIGREGRRYIWVNDLEGVLLMHPYRMDLVGKRPEEMPDPQARKVFGDSARLAKDNETSVIEYLWPDPNDPNNLVAKKAYTVRFAPWNWILGTGIYLDDIHRDIAQITRDMTLAGLVVLLLVALTAAYLTWTALKSDREKAEMLEALRQSEEKFRGISNNAYDGILMINPQGKITFWNRAAQSIFGYQPEEILGKPASLLLSDPWLYEQYRRSVLEPNGEQKDNEGGVTLEITGRHKHGREFPLELAASVVVLQGRRHGVVLARDVSERKHAETALQESETKYRTLFEAAHDALVLMADGVVVDCNTSLLEFMGRPREQIVGTTPVDYAPRYQPDGTESASFAEKRMRLAMQGHPQSFEWALLRSDGELIFCEVTLTRIQVFDQDFLLAIMRDTTERKVMERQRQQALSLLTASIEQSPAGILIAEAKADSYQVRHANAAALEMLGLPRETLLRSGPNGYGRGGMVLLDDRDHQVPPSKEPLYMALQDGSETHGQTYVLKRHNGSKLWIEVNAAPVRDDEGNIRYGVVVLTNVSQRIQAEQDQRKLELALRQSQKMEAIGTLAGGIAHDFNNILFAIMGHAELAELKYASGEPIGDLLQEVVKAGTRAKDLVKQILTFSRQTEDKKAPVEVTPLVKEVLKFLRASMPATVEIKSSLPPDSNLVLADPTNLHQVIMNLCTNAAHAMGEKGGVLGVEVSRINVHPLQGGINPDLAPGPYLQLTVSDTGHGMTRQVRERIFDPFFTTKKQGEGTGLGLSVVHGIVKDLGGDITVYSEPGRGSSFKVLLPEYQGDIQTQPEIQTYELPRLRGNIMLVDDELGVVGSGQAMLEALGCTVTAFHDSRQALERFRTTPQEFDAVITDLTMPGMTGLELTRRIKAVRSDIPVILWTGFSEKLNPGNVAAYGLQAVVMKPPLIRDLAMVLTKAGLGKNRGD